MRITDVVKNLLILNVLFFVAGFIVDANMLRNMFALHFPGSPLFQPIQVVTHFFMHGGIAHIFFNMFALVMFGSALESLWGPRRFLFFYFACAFGAAILHMGVSWYEISEVQELCQSFAAQFGETPTVQSFEHFFSQVDFTNLKTRSDEQAMFVQNYYDAKRALAENARGSVNEAIWVIENFPRYYNMSVPVVGASGAIYGLLLAFGMQFPNVELMLIFLPIPIKAKYFIPVLMLVELFLGVNQFSWDNIAHFAHLGGAITGFLLILYWRKFNPTR